MKVLYTFYHGAAFAWSLIHKLSVHHEDEAYLLVADGWDWCVGNSNYLPLLQKFKNLGIFKEIYLYDNRLGRDKDQYDTLEKTEQAILHGIDRRLKEQKCDINSFDRIYSHTDGEDTMGIYLSLKKIKFYWFENGPKVLILKTEQYVKNIYLENKGYQAALLKHKTLFGESELQSYILYPNSDARNFPVERCQVFDAERAASELPEKEKKQILKCFNLEKCVCPDNAAMLLLQGSWLPSQVFVKNKFIQNRFKTHRLYMYSSIQCMLDYFLPKDAVPILKTHPWQVIDDKISKQYFNGVFSFHSLFTVLLTKSLLPDYIPRYRILLGSTSNQQISANSNDIHCPGVWLFSIFYHKYYVVLDILYYLGCLYRSAGERFETIGSQGNFMGYNINYMATDINSLIKNNFEECEEQSKMKYTIIQVDDNKIYEKILENDFIIMTDVWNTITPEIIEEISKENYVVVIKIEKKILKNKIDILVPLESEYVYFISKSDNLIKKLKTYELVKKNQYAGIILLAKVEDIIGFVKEKDYTIHKDISFSKDNQKEEVAIPISERYEYVDALNVLLKLSEFSTPLPLVFSELYYNRRIVVYSTKEMSQLFKKSISSFCFYHELNVVFCTDVAFCFNGDECSVWFKELSQVEFKREDVFFAFDIKCKKSIIDYVKSKKIRNISIETFRRPFFDALIHYIKCIRPLKNLLSRYPNISVIMTDNFAPPKENLTKWESYIRDNKFTREKIIQELKDGKYPFPKGVYPEEYTIDDILMMHAIPEREYDFNGVFKLCDFESKYVNVQNGMRRTIGQPENYIRKIHVFGGCGIFGIGCPDNATLASCLQEMLNREAPEEGILVENRGNFIFGKYDAMWYSINDTNFNDNDIVIIPYNYKWASCYYRNISNIHYVDMTIHTEADGEVFNDTWHPSANGMKVYARNIFEFLKTKKFLSERIITNTLFSRITQPKQYGIPLFANSKVDDVMLSEENMKQLNDYLDKINLLKRRNGAIVMNCNPFTLGHRYLIEYASQQVDHLYIFAVEEDKSFFKFEDRIELIKLGIEDLSNVTVLSSGKFIISTLTFNDYFGKKELQDKVIDPSLDISLFGKYIAPKLGITVRFAGEEPLDKVTLQYNDAMKKILPQYGIEFVEIPRKECGGEVISASRVRKLLEEQNFEEISKIVPRTTYLYLKFKYKK